MIQFILGGKNKLNHLSYRGGGGGGGGGVNGDLLS